MNKAKAKLQTEALPTGEALHKVMHSYVGIATDTDKLLVEVARHLMIIETEIRRDNFGIALHHVNDLRRLLEAEKSMIDALLSGEYSPSPSE